MAGSASMQDIKRRVRSVTSIEHITSAMKLVSAAKLRRAKKTFENMQEYFHFVTDSIDEIFNNVSGVESDYIRGSREVKTTCYVIVTSNRGLAGSFNSNIIKLAEQEMQNDPETPYIVAVGSRGKDYFERRSYNILSEYMSPPENVSFVETGAISKPIIDLYDEGKIDEVVLVYTSFISSLEQRPRTKTILPFDVETGRDVLPITKQVEYEPSAEEVLNYLVPKYVEIMIYGAIVESATCEHAARRMAMENATDNANAMIEDLNLFYNRARQAAITSEITEIISGSDAINN
ncbi:MAG: ATP synthase F1 subunit gamma [Clostridiales Family XIII bacterium]|jgi:F-type H+-transporting ATPase subunit gamma|nr:ATP synthase F1 subunit gamma [Clostridiales Family XIII bacterium]